MATSWPNFTTTDYAADAPVTLERAEALRDRDLCLLRRPIPLTIGEASSTAATDTVFVEFQVYVPDYAQGYKLALTLDAKCDGDDGDWRLRDKSSTNTGTEVSVADGTDYAESGPSELTLGTDWEGLRTFELIGAPDSTAGTLYLKAEDIFGLRFTD